MQHWFSSFAFLLGHRDLHPFAISPENTPSRHRAFDAHDDGSNRLLVDEFGLLKSMFAIIAFVMDSCDFVFSAGYEEHS